MREDDMADSGEGTRIFFLEAAAWGETCELGAEDAHHLSRVLRLRPGEEVGLLDGEGREGVFCIERIGKGQVSLRRLREWRHPAPPSGLILAAAWTKAARRSWIFEKAVEFGAAGVWFWQAERSQFPVPDSPKEVWRAQLIAGAKQCRNPWLPALRTLPGGVSELIMAGESIPHRHVLLESTFGASPFLDTCRLGVPGLTLCVIGPEGGFAPREADALTASGFLPFSLGERILRWETAAVLCLGLHWWREGAPAKA